MKSGIIQILLGITVLATLVLPGCADPGQPYLEQPFYLPMGSSVKIAGQNLTLRFDAVTNDSRCPRNVNCVTEGEAKCAVTIDDGTLTPVTFTVRGLDWDNAEYKFKKYLLAFKLDPYPTAGQQIPQSDYRLYMTVSIPK